MKITNITDYNVFLINGRTVKPHETICIYDSTDESLLDQIKLLESKNIIMIEY